MNQPQPNAPPPTPATSPAGVRPRGPRTLLKAVAALAFLACGGAAAWSLAGASLWREYQKLRGEERAAEYATPVGFVGINYRRTYNDRPPVFVHEEKGRVLLWSENRQGEPPLFYDVTGADFDPKTLSGGFGRDSIPGVDYPIFEAPAGPHARNLVGLHKVFGLGEDDPPRAYPKALMEKIEVVNDRSGQAPIVVVFDRSREAATAYTRVVNGKEVTFGTTGYAGKFKPLLYDRPTKQLWLPSAEALVCVNGESKGMKLPVFHATEAVTWGEWRSKYPKSVVLIGSDRGKPIPSE